MLAVVSARDALASSAIGAGGRGALRALMSNGVEVAEASAKPPPLLSRAATWICGRACGSGTRAAGGFLATFATTVLPTG